METSTKKLHPKLIATVVRVDPRFKKLAQDINSVWQQIGFDAEPGCGDDNECRIEMCLDADRLTLQITDAEDSQVFVRELYAVYGYTPVLKFLSDQIGLGL